MIIAKIIIGDFEFPLTEDQIENFVGDLTEDSNYAELFDYIAKNTINTDLTCRIINNDGVSDETIKFLLENNSSDLCLWRHVITSNKVSELITEDQLIQFMKQSDAISNEVAYSIEGYESCDAVKIAKWICDNSSAATIKRLAENRSTPKKILKKLLAHENKMISAAAKNTLE